MSDAYHVLRRYPIDQADIVPTARGAHDTGAKMRQFSMYMGGQAVETERTFEVFNPALGEAFAVAQCAEPAQVEAAVAAARSAFPAWSALPDAKCVADMHALMKN